jgi:DNA polymerase V
VKNPVATHLARIEGDSMVDAGIREGDVVVIDRSVEPGDGDIVVAALNGELTVKRLRVLGKNGRRKVWLVAENEAYPPIELLERHELVIWDVVTHVSSTNAGDRRASDALCYDDFLRALRRSKPRPIRRQ